MNDEPTGADTPSIPTETAPQAKRRWPVLLGGVIVALVAWNATVTIPVANALSGDGPHTVVAYRRWFVSPDQIVFDVWRVSPEGSMADMDRLLFKSAEALNGREFSGVVLAHHGSGRFILSGSHFGTIGESYAYENPVYLVRTLTENVTDMRGTPAFGTWTGGLLGVLGRQMEDHNELHRQWYLQSEMGAGL